MKKVLTRIFSVAPFLVSVACCIVVCCIAFGFSFETIVGVLVIFILASIPFVSSDIIDYIYDNLKPTK